MPGLPVRRETHGRFRQHHEGEDVEILNLVRAASGRAALAPLLQVENIVATGQRMARLDLYANKRVVGEHEQAIVAFVLRHRECPFTESHEDRIH
ncbi:hypothetical protein CCR83_00095 [Rhodobacter veldkampii DSM 11550]|nr:hypothetical protein [Phaeovulum veldkampii DSM 11550]